ncbi:hypothetical protein [Kingella oralis]|nr:hypothetical protein [Kingella oralis]
MKRFCDAASTRLSPFQAASVGKHRQPEKPSTPPSTTTPKAA